LGVALKIAIILFGNYLTSYSDLLINNQVYRIFLDFI